jgi:hypothetical protein
LELLAQESQLSPSQVEDLRLAASKMRGVQRRSFQGQMALTYGIIWHQCACTNRRLSFIIFIPHIFVLAFSTFELSSQRLPKASP